MYNDTEALGWHHVELKTNNRSCRPGVDHLGRQLTIKQGTTTSSASYLRKLDWATSTICKHVNCCTNAINESFDKYRPLRFPTLLHLTVGYHYTLEYRTPLCSTSSNRKASSRSGPHRDPSALTPHLWINTELCTQPYSKICIVLCIVFHFFKFFFSYFQNSNTIQHNAIHFFKTILFNSKIFLENNTIQFNNFFWKTILNMKLETWFS